MVYLKSTHIGIRYTSEQEIVILRHAGIHVIHLFSPISAIHPESQFLGL